MSTMDRRHHARRVDQPDGGPRPEGEDQEHQPRQEQGEQEQGQEQQHGQGRSLAEWVALGIASAILLGVAAMIVFFWLTAPQGPPILTISPLDDIRQVGNQFYVPFEIANTGGETAATVHALAELRSGGQVVEQGQLVFNYLAGGERQEGTFVFHHNPADGELRLTIAGFKQP